MMKKMKLVTAALMILIFAGCVTTGAPPKPVITAKWNGKIPQVPILSNADNTVLLRVKNSSGSDMEIKDAVRKAVMDEEYAIVDHIDDASYIARMDLHYFGVSRGKPGTYGKMAGAIGGGVVGGVIGHNTGSTPKSTVGGAAIGALAGLAAGHVIDNFRRTVRYDLVVDVTMEAKGQGKVHCRLVLSAEGRKLDEKTAFPLLERRLSRALGATLP